MRLIVIYADKLSALRAKMQEFFIRGLLNLLSFTQRRNYPGYKVTGKEGFCLRKSR
jgi:hypothetical protein